MTAPDIQSLTYSYYRAIKSSSSCVIKRCGDPNFQFHHVIPDEKLGNVANIARNGTLDELIAELRKCVPICDRHHKEIHSGQRKGWLVGRFNNGVQTWDDSEARKHMPYRPFFAGFENFNHSSWNNRPHDARLQLPY